MAWLVALSGSPEHHDFMTIAIAIEDIHQELSGMDDPQPQPLRYGTNQQVALSTDAMPPAEDCTRFNLTDIHPTGLRELFGRTLVVQHLRHFVSTSVVALHDMLANTLDREALKHVDQSAISATSNASDLINALLNVDNFNVDCVTAVTRLLKEACNDTKRSVELPVDKMCCLFKRLISTTTPGGAHTFEATNVFKEVKPGDYT